MKKVSDVTCVAPSAVMITYDIFRTLHTVMRSPYRSHYRAMLIRPLDTVEFHSNNETHRPVLDSIISFYGRPRTNIRPGQIHRRRSIPDSIPLVPAVKYCPWHQRILPPCRIHRPDHCFRP